MKFGHFFKSLLSWVGIVGNILTYDVDVDDPVALSVAVLRFAHVEAAAAAVHVGQVQGSRHAPVCRELVNPNPAEQINTLFNTLDTIDVKINSTKCIHIHKEGL